MTRRPPSTEAAAYAHLLNDPDWLVYLETTHPEDQAFSSDSMGTQDRRERLMLLTRQDITAARGG
ncbi:hypothetical protein [Ralstonia syzygii]|nr:hypothetical protein [Ralstonia syzygii]